MYHAHFGLERALFGDGIAGDGAVFRSPKHDQLIGHFKLALGSPSSVVVLHGPAGVGKTTLTSAALRASSTRLALAWLNATPTNAAELLELVLVELGVAPPRSTRIERVQLWRQTQGEMRATESRLFVVVERTEDLSVEVLHALDSLTAADAAGNLGANVVLLGHAGLHDHLTAPVLESLRQRIRLRAELAAFTEAELQDYLRHQVACAGGHYDRVFAPGTVAALFRHSGGVARLANTLCATALEVAANEQHELLTAELVTKTAVSFLGLRETAAPAPATENNESRKSFFAATLPAWPAPIAAPIAPVPPVAQAPAAQSPPVTAALPPTAVTAVGASQGLATPAAAAAAPPLPVAASTAVTAPTAPTVVTTAPPPAVEFEFDGGATDISDVAVADFPVLTDAVEEAPAPDAKPAAAPPPAATAPPGAPVRPEPNATTVPKPAATVRPAPRANAVPAAAKPAAPASRPETAYTAAKPVVAPPPQKAAVPLPPVDPDDDELLKQTQTMRAIAVAKSIDDISSSMAETLFGDAELDLVQAALASAAENWTDEAPPGPPRAAAEPEPAKAPAPVDDPFDLFGLGDDAPLELIDDSTLPPIDKARRTALR